MIPRVHFGLFLMGEVGIGGVAYTGAINFECVTGADAKEDVEEAVEEEAEPDEVERGGVDSPIEA